MKKTQGDLIKKALEGEFDVIVHGANCFHTMGGGIAKQVREIFPEAYEMDLETPYADKDKLGTLSMVMVTREDGSYLTVVNAYTQFDHQLIPGQPNVDYVAISQAFEAIQALITPGFRIGIPKIGAGLAGGDWDLIEELIDESMGTRSEEVTLVEYVPE
jgi:O-acetyl-ADP-ribose deacetylase (regulator of RNase III)